MNPKHREKLTVAWKTAAERLGIRIAIPYSIPDANGNAISCDAYLPDFGGAKGIVINFALVPGHKVDLAFKNAAQLNGFSFSFIYFEAYQNYETNLFKETLIDWGFNGEERLRPSWLAK